MGAVAFDRSQESQIARVGHRLPRLQDERRIERVEHGRQPAVMIEMRVCRHDRSQLRRALRTQKRYHDAPARVTLGPARAAIDQQPAPGGSPQCDRVALSNVQETYGEAAAI